MLGSSTSQNLAQMKLTNCAHLDFGDPYVNLELDDFPLGSPLGFAYRHLGKAGRAGLGRSLPCRAKLVNQFLHRQGDRLSISKDLGLVRVEHLERSGDRFISWW